MCQRGHEFAVGVYSIEVAAGQTAPNYVIQYTNGL